MNLKTLLNFWSTLKHAIRRFPGGFKNPLNYFLLVLLWWGVMAFLKERGWCRKKSLRGKHIFITGAGSGLGRRMAVEFALLGAKLSLSDIDVDSVGQTKNVIDKLFEKQAREKPQVLAHKLDVSSREAVKNAAQASQASLGDIDILINNAGIVQGKRYQDMNELMLHKTLVVNLESHYWLINEFLPSMIQRNSGHIVSISSVAGMGGCPEMADYCGSKYGALGLMESLRVEFKRDNINVKTTTICPYFINTGMFDGVRCSPIYPLREQDDVVWRIVNAVQQDEEHVVIPWSMGMLIPLANMHPVHVKDFLGWLLVGWDAMKKFKGRQAEIEEQKKNKQNSRL